MIACLTIPYFPAAVERRDDAALDGRPLVIGGHHWEPRPVYAYSRRAAQDGVRSGMPLRLAHILSPISHFMPATAMKYHCAGGEMVDILIDFTNHLEPDAFWQPGHPGQQTADGRRLPASYYLDFEDLPLAEALPLAGEIGRVTRQEAKLAPAIGLAPNKFAARVAAALARPNHLRPVTGDEESAFLAGQPISFLPFDKEARRRLQLLGICTLGQFAALPRNALREQFGAAIEPLHRLACGEENGRVQPRPPEQVEQVARHFDAPLANRLTLATILEQMAAELAARLQPAGLAGRSLELAWQTDDGAEQTQRLTLRQPAADPVRLAAALQEMLGAAAFADGVVALTVTVADLAPAAAQQLPLFPATTLTERARRTLANVAARHQGCLYYAAFADQAHPLPEQRVHLQTYDPVLA